MKLFSPDSTHWYGRNGEAMHTVRSAKGELRPTNLRDARKLGLLPSVTNILGVIAKPDLGDWKLEQAVLSALTLPRQAGEGEDAFARRVVVDSQGRGRSAAEFGTAFHAGAALVAKSVGIDPAGPCAAWLERYHTWLLANCRRVVWTEQVLVNAELGYAGTGDLLMEHVVHGWTLVDLKTQGAGARPPRPDGRKSEGWKPRVYSAWCYQLAAYRRALGDRVQCLNLIVNSEEACAPVEHLWSEEELRAGWAAFGAAQVIWRIEKRYDPREKRKAEIGKAESPGGRPPGGGIANGKSPVADECGTAIASL